MTVVGLRAFEIVHHEIAAVRLHHQFESLDRGEQIREVIGAFATCHRDTPAPQPIGDFGRDAGTLVRIARAHATAACTSARTRNATARFTTPMTSANHAISAITPAIVRPGYATASTASTRLATAAIVLPTAEPPIAWWARPNMNSARLANNIHGDTEITAERT